MIPHHLPDYARARVDTVRRSAADRRVADIWSPRTVPAVDPSPVPLAPGLESTAPRGVTEHHGRAA